MIITLVILSSLNRPLSVQKLLPAALMFSAFPRVLTLSLSGISGYIGFIPSTEAIPIPCKEGPSSFPGQEADKS